VFINTVEDRIGR